MVAAPTYSQHIASYLRDLEALGPAVSFCSLVHTLGATAIVNPSFPSETCLSRAAADIINQGDDASHFVVWALVPRLIRIGPKL